MNDTKFLSDLEDLLELDGGSLTLTQELTAIQEWDSLAIVGFLAMADAKYKVKVSPSAIVKCRTVKDLMALVVK